MKVYLLNPPCKIKMVREGRCMQRKGAWTAVWPPVTLCTIGAMLENAGYEVKLNDCTVEKTDLNKVLELIRNFQPDLVVINTATGSITNDISTAREIKTVKPDTLVAALGIHVTALPEETLLNFPELDAVVCGEPEFTVLELVIALSERRPLDSVKGLVMKKNSEIINTPPCGFDSDLNLLPFPAWHLIDTRKYLLPFSDRPFLLLTTSKGCPYSCTFCPTDIYYGHKTRLRKPELIADEIEYVKNRYKVKDFLFWTESFTLNRNFAIEVCNELIKRKIDISWVCNSRVDNVDPELLKKLKQAGCWMIGYGVESGNQGILDMAKKHITLQQTIDACKWSKQAGLEVTAHVIFGLPGETPETAKETIGFVKSLNVDYAQFYCAVPFPGCELYNLAKTNHWLITDDWAFFEQNYSVMNLPTMSAKEIIYYRKRAFLEFYLQPKIILKHVRKIKNISNMITFINAIKDFLTWT